MPAISHIVSPYSSAWVTWLLFVCLILVMLNQSARTNRLMVLRNVFSRSERFYTTQTQSWMSIITTRAYEFAALALAVYMLVYQGGAFEMLSYLAVLGMVIVVYFLQLLMMACVGYTFLSSKSRTNAWEQYKGIRGVALILMYPVLLIGVNYPNVMLMKVLCGVIASLYLLLIVGRLLLLFYKNILSFFYVLLYVVYTEVIPMAALLFWAQHIMTGNA